MPSQISHESGFSCTVQFSGSIVAWARKGSSYAASYFSPWLSAFSTSPVFFATAPLPSLALRRSCQISAEETAAFAPSFQLMSSA